jgi:hypothetical protein
MAQTMDEQRIEFGRVVAGHPKYRPVLSRDSRQTGRSVLRQQELDFRVLSKARIFEKFPLLGMAVRIMLRGDR